MLVVKPQENLTRGAEFDHLGKHQAQRLLDSCIWFHLHFSIGGPAVASGQAKSQLATASLLPNRLHRTLSEQVQLELRHGALQPQEEPIINQRRVVNAVGIDDDRTDQTAHLDKVMPVATVTSEPRRLNAENGADVTAADFSHQALKPRAFNLPACRTAQVIVYHVNVSKAQIPGVILEGILAQLAFLVMENLAERGLANIHDRAPAQAVRRQFCIHHLHPPRFQHGYRYRLR